MCHKIKKKKKLQILNIPSQMNFSSSVMVSNLRNIAQYGNHQHF